MTEVFSFFFFRRIWEKEASWFHSENKDCFILKANFQEEWTDYARKQEQIIVAGRRERVGLNQN